MRVSTMFARFFGVAMLVAAAGSVHAQATRTWVSGVGDDANPCSRTAPCKTFAGSISKTAAGGEINCLDAGGFGAVTITKSISIICEGSTAGILVSGTNGVVINAGTNDKVLLQGLDIEGLGTGVQGVRIIGGGSVVIRNSSIRNFSQYGVQLVGTVNARVLIDNSMIYGNTLGGLYVQGNGNVVNNARITNSLFDLNGAASITIASPGTVFVSGSTIAGATAAYAISGGGAVTSYGDNVVRGSGTPTTTTPRS